MINEREEELVMERNDWGTNDEGAIAASISGNSDFNPFLAEAAALLKAAILCTVREAGSLKAIEDAEVFIEPSTLQPVTKNSGGVYAFPAVEAGAYTLTAAAVGFDEESTNVAVAAGEFKSAIIQLGGKEPGPDPDGKEPGATCYGTQSPNAKPHAFGDLLLMILMLAGLARNSRRVS